MSGGNDRGGRVKKKTQTLEMGLIVKKKSPWAAGVHNWRRETLMESVTSIQEDAERPSHGGWRGKIKRGRTQGGRSRSTSAHDRRLGSRALFLKSVLFT